MTTRGIRMDRPLFYLLLFVVGTLILHAVTTTGEMPSTKQYLWPILILFGIGYIAFYTRHLGSMLYWMVIWMSISCFVAIMQSMDIGIAWDLRLAIGGIPEDEALKHQIVERFKPSGLAYFSVQLAYQISVIFPFSLLFLVRSQSSINKRGFMLLVTILIGLGAVVIESLIAIGTVFLSILIVYYYSKRISWRHLAKLTAGLMFIMVILFYAGRLDRLANIRTDGNALSRLPMAIVGAMIVSENLRGVKNSQIDKEKSRVGGSLISNMAGSDMVSEMGLHNSFLSAAVKHGIIVLLCYISIYIYILFRLRKLIKNSNRYNKILYITISTSVLCYVSQSLFHNAGIPTGDLQGWFICVIAISVSSNQNEDLFANRIQIG